MVAGGAGAPRRMVVDLQSSAPHMRLPDWGMARIAEAVPAGWTVVAVAAPSTSLGTGTNVPSAEALAAVRGAEAYFSYGVDPAVLAAAPGVRWVHSASSGVGPSLTSALRAHGAVFTNSAGVYGEAMADSVLAGVLHFVRGLDVCVRQQAARVWDQRPFVAGAYANRELADCRVLVVGAGGVGQAIARRFQALGCAVTGTRRRPALGAPPGCDRVVGADALDAELPGADVVVLAAPATAATAGVLDVRRLALLPPGAIVVNVARAALLDGAALLAALDAGALRGAVLDVFPEEPLPPASPDWGHPGVLVIPHASPISPARQWARVLALFAANWAAWDAGAPLQNVVDQDAGY